MTVLYNDRTLPISANASNTAFSANVNLSYDFTGIGALASGDPWVYAGATKPTLVTTGSVSLQTINGEPSRVSGASTLYDYLSTTDYGLQSGSGDFTIAMRINLPATLPTTSNAHELLRISGSAGTALSLMWAENGSSGWYLSVGSSSTAIPLGTTQPAIFYPANKTVMVWIRKASGVVTVFTQDATAKTDAVVRCAASAAATAPLDATWATRLLMAFSNGSVPTWGLAAFKHWTVAHSDATINAIGKDFWDSEANVAASSTIAITSPTMGSTIAATSVISGTYTGTAPAGVEVQHNGGSWVAGTSATISGGTWLATFSLPGGGPGILQARYSNETSTVSSAITGITVSADSLAFTVPFPYVSANIAAPYRIFQRNGSNQASVRITGTYTGSPTSIQYQWNGGAWTMLVASPAGGIFDATVTLTGPAQGDLSIRFSNNTSASATMVSVGIGDVFIVSGQSNHVGGGNGTYVPPVAPGAHPTWKASIYDKTGRWRENVETATDPFSKITNASIYPAASAVYSINGAGGAYNSYFGKLATACMSDGIPVAFVPVALGSTSLAAWVVSTSTTTLYGAMLAEANAIGDHKAVLWWQGEADCGAGTIRSAYESGLNGIINDWCSTRFPGKKWVLMNLCSTGNSVGTGGTGASDTGFNAIHAAIANVGSTNSNVHAVADMNGAFSTDQHYVTSGEITIVASRAYAAIKSMITYVPSITLNLVSAAGSAIASAAPLKWAWFDSVTPDLFVAPTDNGSVESTDASGVLAISLTNSTKTSGQVGWLVVTNSDGNPATVHKAFSGPVAVA